MDTVKQATLWSLLTFKSHSTTLGLKHPPTLPAGKNNSSHIQFQHTGLSKAQAQPYRKSRRFWVKQSTDLHYLLHIVSLHRAHTNCWSRWLPAWAGRARPGNRRVDNIHGVNSTMEWEPYSRVKGKRKPKTTAESSSSQGTGVCCADQWAPQPKRQHMDPKRFNELKVWYIQTLAPLALKGPCWELKCLFSDPWTFHLNKEHTKAHSVNKLTLCTSNKHKWPSQIHTGLHPNMIMDFDTSIWTTVSTFYMQI